MAKFEPGQSGNRKGRPAGSKDRRTELRGLFQPQAKELIEKAVALALEGDLQALRMCLDRICPPLKPQAEHVKISTTGTCAERADAIFQAAATGRITPDTAEGLMSLLAMQVRIVEDSDIKKRMEAFEALLAKQTSAK